MPADVSQILVPFGFTGLESEIYTFLLQESPATGYRVAQAIGKAAANTYKALESLQQKGAILVDEATNRQCRAVPPEELLARLSRDFEWRRADAELRLANLNAGTVDDRIYSLRSRAQVVERVRHMTAGAQSVVLVSCSSHVLHQIRDSLVAAASRKIRVFVACDERVDIRGVQSVVTGRTTDVSDIRIVADGCEHLAALFKNGEEEVAQAIWTRSPYLSVSAHRGLAAELILVGLLPPSANETVGYSRLARN